MSSLPKACCDRQGLNLFAPPPGALVAASVKLAMMQPADREGEAVADLPPHRPLLGKFGMVGIAGNATADETGLGSNEPQLIAVALAHRLADDSHLLGARGYLARLVGSALSRRDSASPN